MTQRSKLKEIGSDERHTFVGTFVRAEFKSFQNRRQIINRPFVAELVLKLLHTDIFTKNGKKAQKDDEINTYTTCVISNIYCCLLRSDCLF